jgi:hypothetical protein
LPKALHNKRVNAALGSPGLIHLESAMDSPNVFISYAREDVESAKRLYRDLSQAGLRVWFDKESLLPGQKWEVAVRKAIEASRFFLAVISANSARKKGYVQREFRKAFEILDEYPDSETYLIPVRLDDSEPPQERLKELHYADLFPDWNSGLEKILLAMNIDTKLSRTEYSFPSAMTKVLVDPSSNPDDKYTLLLMLAMKQLDRDIEERRKDGREIKEMIDNRSKMFDELRVIIDRSNQRAKEIIDSIRR